MLKLFRKYRHNNFRKHSETDNLLLNKKSTGNDDDDDDDEHKI